MPCFSRTTLTAMTSAGQLAAAMVQAGYEIVQADELRVSGRHPERGALEYYRMGEREAFRSSSAAAAGSPVPRAYAEIGLRTWAKRKGYAVVKNDGRRVTLQSRRG